MDHQSLGPKWTSKELRTFFILLKAFGSKWEKFVDKLPHRSVSMVRTLYQMHRGYLSLSEASAEGLCAIMQDHYQTIEQLVSASSGDLITKALAAAANLTPTSSSRSNHQQSADVRSVSCAVRDEHRPGHDATSTPGSGAKRKRKLDALFGKEAIFQGSAGVSSSPHASTRHGHDLANDASSQCRRLKRNCSRKLKSSASENYSSSPQGPRRARWDFRDASLKEFKGRRFDLPWFDWFYCHMDVDFFQHNEFLECLHRMGLGKITRAARPIWASVRSSMGHPRRLSPLFLAQEIEKLEAFRRVWRQNHNVQELPSDWPFRAPRRLTRGSPVLVRLNPSNAFVLGHIAQDAAHVGTDKCLVELAPPRQEVVTCTMESFMLLDGSDNYANLSGEERTRMALEDRNAPPDASTATGTVLVGSREQILKRMAIVKDLLVRKERLLAALSELNQSFVQEKTQVQRSNISKSVFQRQYAWLIVNLDLSNKHLNAALARLQELRKPASEVSCEANGVFIQKPNGRVDPDPELNGNAGANAMTESLTISEMKWARDFLSSATKKSQSILTSEMQFHSDTKDVRLSSSIQELISTCVLLKSLLSQESSRIPANVQRKLVERVLELIIPHHNSNADLYKEIQSAIQLTPS